MFKFEVKIKDKTFYNEKLKDRLPNKIIDSHSHMTLKKHLVNIPKSRIDSDWALQSEIKMPIEEARGYARDLFPGKEYEFVSFAFPIIEADIEGGNNYISTLIKNKDIVAGLYISLPEWDIDKIKKDYDCGGFKGFKPYPDLIAVKGSETSIFDFFTRDQFELANSLKAKMVLHLPRAGRIADDNNIKELKEIVKNYPDIKVIIAHLGRSYNYIYFEEALKKLGRDIHKFWFDTSAVANPQVLELAFKKLDPEKLLFGLDLPILLWHGKRIWKDNTYINLCQENLAWNKHIEGYEKEKEYTFFVYEQLNNALNTIEKIGYREDFKEKYFYKNVTALY